VGTALSVVALHGLRPADPLAVELAGSAVVLLAVAAVTGRLRRRGAGSALLQPLAGALTAIVLLGEPLVAGQALGGAFILAGLVLLTRDGPGDQPGRSADDASAADAVTTLR
jgi:drug/metabolite transporter (DMT)-like permease